MGGRVGGLEATTERDKYEKRRNGRLERPAPLNVDPTAQEPSARPTRRNEHTHYPIDMRALDHPTIPYPTSMNRLV